GGRRPDRDRPSPASGHDPLAAAIELERADGPGPGLLHPRELAGLERPEAQGVAAPAGDEVLAVAREHEGHPARANLEAVDQLAGPGRRHAHGLVPAARADQAPVGRRAERVARAVVTLELVEQLAFGPRPDPDDAARVGADQLVVGREA